MWLSGGDGDDGDGCRKDGILIRNNLFNFVFGGGICGICSICGGICCIASGSGSYGNIDYGGPSFSHHHSYHYNKHTHNHHHTANT